MGKQKTKNVYSTFIKMYFKGKQPKKFTSAIVTLK